MLKEEYEKLYALEQEHWYFQAKRNFVKPLLDALPSGPRTMILEAGCGTGFNHLFLQNYGCVVSVDLSPDALDFCRRRSISRLVQGDLNRMCFKENSFEMVVALDVLYHSWVRDDLAVLRDFHSVLKSKGKLLITDSAFSFLTSRHDESVMARERYSIPNLKRKVRQAGFTIRKASYMFAGTFPMLALIRLAQKYIKRDPPQSSVFHVPAGINGLLIQWMRMESRLMRHFDLPFGSSLLILAEKNSQSPVKPEHFEQVKSPKR